MGNLYMRFPGGRKKAFTMSYDDATRQDIRLIGLMRQYGLKGTFNISTGILAPEGIVYEPGTIHQRMSRTELIGLYKENGMEAALHGYTHSYMDQLPIQTAMEEVIENKRWLEREFQTVIRGMAYPYGRYSDELVRFLKQAGIAYARTTVSGESFELPKDWLRLEATCHHNHPRLMEFAKRFVSEEVRKSPWMFYLWGHSFEFDRDQNWDVMERLAACVGNREEIWYATNIEICDYVTAYGRLRFSMEGTIVQNPTSRELFFETGDGVHSVKSGEELVLPRGILTQPGLQNAPIA